jgi:HEAT repeat protein
MFANRLQRRALTTEACWLVSCHVVLILGIPATATLNLTSSALAQPPGPELFAKEPRTPLELWGAIDYLVRTGQTGKALPYLDKFVKSKPDDETWIAIRDQYGPGSILRLDDDVATRRFTKPLADALIAAARKYANEPKQMARLVTELTGTPTEQDYAIRHLRTAGPHAVPFLIDALSHLDLSAEKRNLLIRNMGRLDSTAAPALVAVLDSTDTNLAPAAASALGLIGDKEAIPHLTFAAADPHSPPASRSAAQAALARLTGLPFASQSRTPVQVLTAAAWRYHRHEVEVLRDPVLVWRWDNDRNAPVAQELTQRQAEANLGLQLARKALLLDPKSRDAQVAQLSLALEDAVLRVGWREFPAKTQPTFAAAIPTGPAILSSVLTTAMADGKADLAAAAAMALGQLTDRNALASNGRPHPLVDALNGPGRRVQFTAAKALVDLGPTQSFAGSSRIIPTLSRFLAIQALPRVVVIDGNPNRGSQLAGFLIALGYDPQLEPTGNQGFQAAAETADVEIILISFDLFKGWGLNDTLANLRADSRTAAIPIAVYGPLNMAIARPNLEHDYPGIRFVVQPADAGTLQRQLKDLPAMLSREELTGYAREAAILLARIARDQKGPLAAGLATAEPSLAAALRIPETSSAAAAALGNIPAADAQRSLADTLLDPSQTPVLRSQSATHLVSSIRKFGPLLSADQEARLVATLHNEPNPNLAASLAALMRTLIPKPSGALAQQRPSRAPRAPSATRPKPTLSPPSQPRVDLDP